MALSFEEYKALRADGLSDEQIDRFEAGQTPKRNIDFGQAAKAGLSAITNPSPSDLVQGAGNPVLAAGVAGLGSLYGQGRQALVEEVPKDVRNKVGDVTQRVVPVSNLFPKETVGDFVTGLPIDVVGGMIAERAAPAMLKGGVSTMKGVDKQATSLLNRLSGASRNDIKTLRQLEAEGGRGFVLNKTKSKPEYMGREIAPKASELARSRVSSMEPEALREIGVSPESTQIAQDVKGKFGLKEFPTKSTADDLFDQVINSASPDSRITPNNLSKAIGELESQGVNLKELKQIKGIIEGSPSSPEALLQGSGKRLNQLTPDEYRNLRIYLNDLTDSGNNPFFQKLKNAWDMDAEAVIPDLQKAKGVFQVSRELPKAETYLDKTKLPEEMSRRLESAADPKNVNVRESAERLLGPEGEALIKDAQAQRISKQMYAPSNLSTRPVGNVNNILDLVRLPGRMLQRGYEISRSRLLNTTGTGFNKGGGALPPKMPPTGPTLPPSPRMPIDYAKATYKPGSMEGGGNYPAFAPPEPPIDPLPYKPTSNVPTEPMGYGPYTKKPISPDEIPVSEYFSLEDLPEAPSRSGVMGYKGGSGKTTSPYNEPSIQDMRQAEDVLGYRGGSGGSFSGPDIPIIPEQPNMPYGPSLPNYDRIKIIRELMSKRKSGFDA